jgi:hypothetical protein
MKNRITGREDLNDSILNVVGMGKSGSMASIVYETAWVGTIPFEEDLNAPVLLRYVSMSA